MAWSAFPDFERLQGLHGAADLSRKLPGGRVGRGTEMQWGPSVQGYVLVTRDAGDRSSPGARSSGLALG